MLQPFSRTISASTYDDENPLNVKRRANHAGEEEQKGTNRDATWNVGAVIKAQAEQHAAEDLRIRVQHFHFCTRQAAHQLERLHGKANVSNV